MPGAGVATLIAACFSRHYCVVAVFGNIREGVSMKAKSKSEYKIELRQRAMQKVRPKAAAPGKGQPDALEAERRKLLTECAEGGDPRGKKIQNELAFLLTNYAPRNDHRIEQLIDEWRRCGDPAYDPSIRIRHRQARQNHMCGGSI